jgi:hypothetical protein
MIGGPNDIGLWKFSPQSRPGSSQTADIINAMIEVYTTIPRIRNAHLANRSHTRQNSFTSNTIPGSTFQLMCPEDCHYVLLRTIDINESSEPTLITSFHRPLYSKLSLFSTKLPQLDIPIMPKEGLWVGTFGNHGPEVVLLRYDTLNNETILTASKITGDINVPKGVVTFTAFLSRGPLKNLGNSRPDVDSYEISELCRVQNNVHLVHTQGQAQEHVQEEAAGTVGTAGGIREATWWSDEDETQILERENINESLRREYQNLNVDDSNEFKDSCVYPGIGTIALLGFRSPSRVSVDGMFLCDLME